MPRVLPRAAFLFVALAVLVPGSWLALPEVAAAKPEPRDPPAGPSGEVNVVGDPNAVVRVDDHVVGVLPLALPLQLPIGPHRIAVERDSLRLEDGVTVKAGRTAEVRCQFHPGVLVVTLSPALLLLTSHPALSGESAAGLEQAVRESAGLAHLALLKRKEALMQAPKLAECLDSVRCQLELATENLLEYVLSLTAVVRPGTASDWQLGSVLLNATVGDVAAEQQKECLGCSEARAAELLAQLAAEVLKAGLGRPRGTLEIESTPLGAEVTAGERLAGVTPLRRSQWAGPLTLTIKRPGFRSQTLALNVNSGQTVSLKLTLLPSAEPPPAVVPRTVSLPRPRWRLGVGTAALGAGAVMVGLGISGLLAGEHCLPLAPRGMECSSTYLRPGTGAAVSLSGALLVAGGIILVALPGPRQKLVLTSTLLPGGLGGRVSWQF